MKLNIQNKKDYHILQVLFETTKMTISELSNTYGIPEQKIIKLKTNHHWFRTKERKLEYLKNSDMYKPLILDYISANVNDKQVEIITDMLEVDNISNKDDLDIGLYKIIKDLETGEYLGISIDNLSDIDFHYKQVKH